MSYGPDESGYYSRVAGYVDRFLRGEKPGNLPVQVPTTKFELIINLKTARALGIDIPLKQQPMRSSNEGIAPFRGKTVNLAFGAKPTSGRQSKPAKSVESDCAAKLAAIPAGESPANRGVQSLL